ncbi:thioesterase II family protein [Streptomyces sp. NPDC017095]|uniref:thioesterase II family protein n=1 Tax=Streptomyces sp. NPDC017095 TaxID=3364977 RepID=UPI0037A44507
MSGPRNAWTIGKPLADRPVVTLYCFPHSGALVSEFVRWGGRLPGVQVYGICPPGRGPRSREREPDTVAEFVRDLVDETEFAEPAVFFGHSLGALTAYETIRELRARGKPLPRRLIASAHAAPQLGRTATGLSGLSDPRLMAEIEARYGALPPHVTANPELTALVVQAFRADLRLLDSYRHQPGDPLPVPIEVFGGEQDTSVPPGTLLAWRHRTAGDFTARWFTGDHFYFRHAPEPVYAALRNALLRPLPSKAGL